VWNASPTLARGRSLLVDALCHPRAYPLGVLASDFVSDPEEEMNQSATVSIESSADASGSKFVFAHIEMVLVMFRNRATR
jgi:hypothetical protein